VHLGALSPKGDNRSRLDVNDIVALFIRADETDKLSKLSVFVAGANPDKLPYMKPEDLDICILARKLLSMESIIKNHDVLLSSLNQPVADNLGASGAVLEKTSSSNVVHTSLSSLHVVPHTAAPAVLWANVAAESGSSEDGEFKRITYNKLKSPPVHHVLWLVLVQCLVFNLENRCGRFHVLLMLSLDVCRRARLRMI